MVSRTRAKRAGMGILSGAILMGALAGCGSAAQSSGSKTVNLVFATQGLGTEAQATQQAVKEFEKLHPHIHVQIETLSASSNSAYQTLVTDLNSGSATPDVITSDVIWPPTFAAAKWIMPLNQFHPNMSRFYPGMVKAGEYKGKLYAIPWFINVEGVYYRTDLVKSPPKTFTQLVSDAKAAMAKNPKLIGLAFEGNKYEGAVTVFQDVSGGFGGSFLNSKGQPVLNSPQNIRALTWLDNAIKTGLSPKAVTGWEEGNVQQAFLSGDAVFATNWPYLYPLAEQKGSAVINKVGFVPPPTQGGKPTASLGGDDLVINKNTKYPKQAWELVSFLTSAKTMTQRALISGDPPARTDAYTPALLKKAPWFKQEEAVYADATPRPVTPLYPRISARIQEALSATYSGQLTPKQALDQAQKAVQAIVSGHGS
ncbi:MAG: ABC transporter substrate-binding protein [Firmicutes bacterium]|nr:ABC transporter substrate-binding protein [Bacillota bacterium]MCL5013969.1 ABC transporter substrate-binding protein [Bacillota bacterium]